MLKKFSVSTNKISENLYWFAIAPVLSMDLCAGFQDELTPTKGTSTTAPDTPRSRCRQLPTPNCQSVSISTNKISENLCWFAIGRFLSMDIGTASACGMAWFLLALSAVEGVVDRVGDPERSRRERSRRGYWIFTFAAQSFPLAISASKIDNPGVIYGRDEKCCPV